MSTKVPRRTVISSILVAVLLVSGCLSSEDGDVVRTGDLETENTFVEQGAAQAVDVHLDLGRADLEVMPGSARLMEATFRYNIDRWRPMFTYVDEGDVWNLTVRQPDQDIKVEADAVNEWDLKFSNRVTMAMGIEMDAGNADVKVTSLDLVSLSVNTGSGDIALDLTGNWYSHLVVRASTGAGNINLFVSSNIGVQVSVNQGSGTVVAPGFENIEGNYKNAAFDTSEVVILVAVDIGSGDLVIIEVD